MTPIDLPGVISPADLDRELLPGERFIVEGESSEERDQAEEIFDKEQFVLCYEVDGCKRYAAARIHHLSRAGDEWYFYSVIILRMPEHLITELPEEVEA